MTATPTDPLYDALVVGGGPAGSSAAARLARLGHRVLVAERERFPRFHIGESLIPQTNDALRRLGVYGTMEDEGFPVKRGAILIAADGEHRNYADFSRARGIDDAETWEVPRHRFDQILLDHATRCGAEVHQETRATGAEPGEDWVSVELRAPDAVRTVRARTLVDASGRDGFLAKRLGLRRFDPELRHVGLHAWYEGVVPPPPERAGDLRLISLDRTGWAWLIPLDGRVTSVGVVVSRERHAELPTASPARCLDLLLAEVPALPPLLASARRISDVRVDGDYSYSTRAYAGDRWLLAGDAGSFLDPVFSTGVLLALEGGLDAADAVHEGLVDPRARRRAFHAYSRAREREYRYWRRFVTGFYRPEFRDLLLQPEERLRLSDAVVTVLAGNTRPSLATRVRLELFFAAVALQRVVELVPRLGAGEGRRSSTPPGRAPGRST